jgi:hypothetical protein
LQLSTSTPFDAAILAYSACIVIFVATIEALQKGREKE